MLEQEVLEYMDTLNYSEKEKLLKYLLLRYYNKEDINRTEYELSIGNYKDGYYNPKREDEEELTVNGV